MGEIIHKTPIRKGSISFNPENLRPVQKLAQILHTVTFGG
jgi:hypothetical protein